MRSALALVFVLLAAPAIAQRATVFNYVEGKRSQLDEFAHEHYGRSYQVIDVSERERFVFPKGPGSVSPPPVSVRGRCIAGVVTVLFIISAEGAVVAPHVAKTENAILSGPALAKMKEQRFQPARVDGKPASMVAVTDIQFRCPNEGGKT